MAWTGFLASRFLSLEVGTEVGSGVGTDNQEQAWGVTTLCSAYLLNFVHLTSFRCVPGVKITSEAQIFGFLSIEGFRPGSWDCTLLAF